YRRVEILARTAEVTTALVPESDEASHSLRVLLLHRPPSIPERHARPDREGIPVRPRAVTQAEGSVRRRVAGRSAQAAGRTRIAGRPCHRDIRTTTARAGATRPRRDTGEPVTADAGLARTTPPGIGHDLGQEDEPPRR